MSYTDENGPHWRGLDPHPERKNLRICASRSAREVRCAGDTTAPASPSDSTYAQSSHVKAETLANEASSARPLRDARMHCMCVFASARRDQCAR